MFNLFDYMKKGNTKQKDAYKAINELGIFNSLKIYNPVLCGTIPIGIDLDNSDLDIIMNVRDLDLFEQKLKNLYRSTSSFNLKRTIIRGREVRPNSCFVTLS
ncbi:protein of unknown function [Thalassobacillus cyri]|uniref:DUF4269 domain-containing protein n=1 Tax=Thalassobacillus cyri TaxID=571932 RepID=A0A1H3WAK4_9BACI|nr:protein of unknown function [Thalassobacillus cyri]